MGMARCQMELRAWEAAIRDMTTGLVLMPQEASVRLIRIIMLQDGYGGRPDWKEVINRECHRELSFLKKEVYDQLTNTEK